MDDPTEFLLRLQERMDRSLSLAQSAWQMAQATEKRTTELLEAIKIQLAEATKPPLVAEANPSPATYPLDWRHSWGWAAAGLSGGLVLGGFVVALRLWVATPLSGSEILKLLFGG